jgi:acetylornithine/succinyldiaminopimelate/putrescine aminotransferase/acyl-CoA synthetase (AMP-forming)/AMP-acid ligase II/predicted amino acid dehydrogenase/acyl carrier protein
MAVPSLLHLLRRRAVENRDDRAYTFVSAGTEADSLTFSQLEERSRAIGARLQQLGARGERALLLYPQGTDYITAFYGCLAAGTVAVPGYPPRMNRNLSRFESIVADARPKVALTTESVYRQISERFDEHPALKQMEWLVTSEVQNEEAAGWVDPNVDRDTLAFLQYTSASTSAPKGVMVTHGNILHNQALMRIGVRHTDETVIVSWLPLFHDMGLIGVVLASLYNASPCYLLAAVDFLKKPRLWLEAITRYRATFSGGPDFAYQLCVDSISEEERAGLDLSSWVMAFNGSEPVRAGTVRNFKKAFAPCGFRPDALFAAYGLAEHTLYVSVSDSGPQQFSRVSLEQRHPRPALSGTAGEPYSDVVSCGSALLDTKIAIADPESRRRCGEGEIGEIWLSSPSVAQGYWNQPKVTEEMFRARLLDDGDTPYFRTGDLGFFHDGELFVTGRIKDLVIIHGRNLIPADLEQTVEKCDPAIRPAFVAAVSVEAGNAERLIVIAEVRREARHDLNTAALIERIRGAVSTEFAVQVSAVTLLKPGSLPKTSSGKTQRALAKQGFTSGTLSGIVAEWRDADAFRPEQTEPVAPAPKARGLERLERWLVERVAAEAKVPVTQIDLGKPLMTYGLDSVVLISIVGQIEQTFGVHLDVEMLFDGEPTLREVVRRIQGEPAPKPVAVPPPIGPRRLPLSHRPVEGPRTLRAMPSPKAEPRTPSPIGREHPYRSHVNPELGRVLAQMGMDKTFVRGEGSWLWDTEGQKYLDFLAQYGALPFGFNPPRIWQALLEVHQASEPSFVQPSYLDAAGELARRLLAAAPAGMAYVTFGNSGAEAIEAAIKLCRSTTGRHDILSATNGFHGKTLGALSATDKEKYQAPFGAPVPGFSYVPYGDLEALRRALSTGRYAGFIVEPLQGEGGIVEPPAGYLRLARKACRENGTLFVADEIQTGLGRTGTMFVCRELGITPDVMTVAKALGGGLMPIGACLSSAAAYNDDFALKHTSTFAGNTLACRAGIATLDLLEEHGGALMARVAENGARLKEALLALQRSYPGIVGEVRGRGYFLGMNFSINRHNVEEGLLGYLGEQEALTAIVVSHLLHVENVRVGYTLNQGGVLRIEPPLTATWEECEVFLQALTRVLERIDRRNLALLTSPVTGYRTLPEAAETHRTRLQLGTPDSRPRQRRLDPQRNEGRFAFLAHPLAWKDFGDIDSSLSVLSDAQLGLLSTALGDNFDPLVIGETRVTGNNGKSAYGEFILVPRRAEELKAMTPRQALNEVLDAARVAKKRGAKIVGLGAYTSVVTQGGLSLKGRDLPALTSGNSYTVVAARQTVRLAAAERGWALPRRAVGIIGAGGAVGQALSILLSRDAGRLVLVGNPEHAKESRERLLQVAGRMVCSLDQLRGVPFAPGSVASWIDELELDVPEAPDRAALMRLGEQLIARSHAVALSVDPAEYLPEVDVVVCCTSTTERIVGEELLRPSAIVCDVSRPSNVAAEVRVRRPDVTVIESGIVRMPNDATLGFNASIGRGNAYACMAETMMLAMEQRYQDASLGFDLPLEQVLEMERLADDLGFRVLLESSGMKPIRPRSIEMRLHRMEESEVKTLAGAPSFAG